MLSLLDVKTLFHKKVSVQLSKCLHENLVSFLQVSNRNQALQQLVDLLKMEKILEEGQCKDFYSALLDRERIISTGIGMGIAIPHAKLKKLSEFFIVIGIQKQKGLDWQSLDHTPVRLIFLVGGPEEKQTEYLQLLSQLTHALKEESLRKKLLSVTSSREVIDLFLQL